MQQELKNRVLEELPTASQSLTYIRNLLRTAISSICYLRGLFEESHFVDKNLCGVHIKALSPTSEHAKMLTQWLEHGVFDALQKKCLRTIIFGICLDPSNEASLVESYHFLITYPSPNEIGVIVGEDGKETIVPSKENIKYATTTLLRRLICLTQTFEELPKQRYILMKLNYYEDKIPEGYSPQFFTTGDQELTSYDNEISIGDIVTPHHTLQLKIYARNDIPEQDLKPINEETDRIPQEISYSQSLHKVVGKNDPTQMNENSTQMDTCSLKAYHSPLKECHSPLKAYHSPLNECQTPLDEVIIPSTPIDSQETYMEEPSQSRIQSQGTKKRGYYDQDTQSSYRSKRVLVDAS